MESWRVDSRAVYIAIEWLLRQLVIMVFFLSKVEMDQPRLLVFLICGFRHILSERYALAVETPLPKRKEESKKVAALSFTTSLGRSSLEHILPAFAVGERQRGQLRVQTGLSRGNSMSNESGDATVVRLLCRGQYEH